MTDIGIKIAFAAVLFLSPAVRAQSLTFSLDDAKATKGKEITFVAPSGHHFNSEAPNKVRLNKADPNAPGATISINGNKLTATWTSRQDFCAGVAADLYVCDDPNTYCMPVHQTFACAGESKLSPQASAQTAAASAPTPLSALDNKEEFLFIKNDPEKALDEAKKSQKPLLIDFFAIWCPPCNQLDEAVFSSREFESLSQKFVLLKLDADSPASWSLKSKFKITGYPTVIFADENGDEINRVVGFREKPYFIASMKHALTGKGGSFEQKKTLAEGKNNAAAAYDVGLIYLEREEYPSANFYLYKASRAWSLADIRRNKLLSSILGLQQIAAQTPEAKKAYVKLLENSLEWYPRQEEVFDRADELAKVAGDLGDKSAVETAHQATIATAKWYLTHPRAMKQTDYTRGDLYETLGDAYEATGDMKDSQDAYGRGADEYLKAIVSAKLNPDSERGFNLERTYCLWKSGRVTEAEQLYGKLEKLYPAEFTFYYQHGRLLNDAKDYKRAQDEAEKAYRYSYGDNKLRAAGLLAEVYKNLDKKRKAIGVLDDTIKNFQLPADQSIRTHRYYDHLVQMRDQLKKS